MKNYFTFLFLSLSLSVLSQNDFNKNCKPNIDISVKICGQGKDSVCTECYHCRTRLVSIDSNFTVISFVITAGGKGFEDEIMEEAVIGNYFNTIRSRVIITKLIKGSFIEINCIKAKDKNGRIYTLKPLFIEI
jgi:hypothetical protein